MLQPPAGFCPKRNPAEPGRNATSRSTLQEARLLESRALNSSRISSPGILTGEPGSGGVRQGSEPTRAGGRSALEGVGKLQEELARNGRETVTRGSGSRPDGRFERPAVPVAQEKDGLPVELVRKERRAVEVAGLARHRKGVEARIPLRRNVLTDQPQERPRREGVRRLQPRDLRREEPPAVDVQPPPITDERQLQMVGGPRRERRGNIASVPGPHVVEIDFAADKPVDGDGSQPPRRVDRDRPDGLRPVEHLLADPDGIDVDSHESQQVPRAVEVHSRKEAARHEGARPIDDVVLADPREEPPEEAFRVERVSDLTRALAYSDLRNAPVVGAETVGEVAILAEPPECARLMAPGDVDRAARKGSAIPLRRQVRLVGSPRGAVEKLAGDLVAVVWPPLKVGTDYPVVPAARDLAIGREEPGEGLTVVVPQPSDGDERAKVLRGEARRLRAGHDDEAPAAVLAHEKRVCGAPVLSRHARDPRRVRDGARVDSLNRRLKEVHPFQEERPLLRIEEGEALVGGDLSDVRLDLREIRIDRRVHDLVRIGSPLHVSAGVAPRVGVGKRRVRVGSVLRPTLLPARDVWRRHEMPGGRKSRETGDRPHVADQAVGPSRDRARVEGIPELARVVPADEDSPRGRVLASVPERGKGYSDRRRPPFGSDLRGGVVEEVGGEILVRVRLVPDRVALDAARIYAELDCRTAIVAGVQEDRHVVVGSDHLIAVHERRPDPVRPRVVAADPDVERLLVVGDQDGGPNLRGKVVSRLRLPELVDRGGAFPSRIGEVPVDGDRRRRPGDREGRGLRRRGKRSWRRKAQQDPENRRAAHRRLVRGGRAKVPQSVEGNVPGRSGSENPDGCAAVWIHSTPRRHSGCPSIVTVRLFTKTLLLSRMCAVGRVPPRRGRPSSTRII